MSAAKGTNARPLRPGGKLLAEDARRHHRALILQHLFSDGPLSRADLARATGLTRVTVSDLVGAMIGEGLLADLGAAPEEGRVGKPPTLVGIVGDALHIVALDLSADDVFVGTVQDLAGTILVRHRVPREGAMGEAAISRVMELASHLVEKAGSRVLGIGVGTPGIVTAQGVVRSAPNVGWADLDLAGLLSRRFSVPAYVSNDAKTAALGEHTFGGASGDFMLVRIANGVGAGLVIGGALLHGSSSAAGEIGHVTVGSSQERCACGRIGCLETILSERAIERLDAAELHRVGESLGEVLAPLVGVLNLREVVIVGPPERINGGIAVAAEAVVRERTMPASTAEFTLRTSTLGEGVVLAGAAVLVLSGELGVS